MGQLFQVEIFIFEDLGLNISCTFVLYELYKMLKDFYMIRELLTSYKEINTVHLVCHEYKIMTSSCNCTRGHES